MPQFFCPAKATAVGLGFAALLVAAPIAWADQCAYVSVAQAEKARKILESVSELVEYCELCTGDTPKLSRIQDVEVRKVADNQREIYVNGAPIDLAYAFVPDGDVRGQFKNLSKLSGCPSDSVSTVITYPPKAGAAAADDWAGRYVKGEVEWELTHEGTGPAYSVVVEFGTQANGNDRGQLKGGGEIDGGIMGIATPVGTCRYSLSRSGKKLKVVSSGDCGAFGPYLSGEFRPK